jgi:hypothetical protein
MDIETMLKVTYSPRMRPYESLSHRWKNDWELEEVCASSMQRTGLGAKGVTGLLSNVIRDLRWIQSSDGAS